jgi:hypothetical protein
LRSEKDQRVFASITVVAHLYAMYTMAALANPCLEGAETVAFQGNGAIITDVFSGIVAV